MSPTCSQQISCDGRLGNLSNLHSISQVAWSVEWHSFHTASDDRIDLKSCSKRILRCDTRDRDAYRLAALKKLERFRAFMRFCLPSVWIAENFAGS